MTPRPMSWYRARVDAADTPLQRLDATSRYLRAALVDRDPDLVEATISRATAQLCNLAELVLSTPTVAATAWHLPAELEDPARPGWLHADELRRRRRRWSKSKLRRDFYDEIAAGALETCTRCSARSAVLGGDAYLVPDHIVPLARGGENVRENLQPLCWLCNSRKGAYT